jgi:hypothetical protein
VVLAFFLGFGILSYGDKVRRIVFGRFLQRRRSLWCGRVLICFIFRGFLLFLGRVFGQLKYLRE